MKTISVPYITIADLAEVLGEVLSDNDSLRQRILTHCTDYAQEAIRRSTQAAEANRQRNRCLTLAARYSSLVRQGIEEELHQLRMGYEHDRHEAERRLVEVGRAHAITIDAIHDLPDCALPAWIDTLSTDIAAISRQEGGEA